MTKPDGFRLTTADAAARLPEHGLRFVQMAQRGTLSVELYAPRGQDEQTPHRQDELYIVVSGSGTFSLGSERQPFGPGDVLFVPAGAEHRFVEFSDDFQTWVVFYGPDGGERP